LLEDFPGEDPAPEEPKRSPAPKDTQQSAAVEVVCRSCGGTGKDVMGKPCTCEAGLALAAAEAAKPTETIAESSPKAAVVGGGVVSTSQDSSPLPAPTLLSKSTSRMNRLRIDFAVPNAAPQQHVFEPGEDLGFICGGVGGQGCGCLPLRQQQPRGSTKIEPVVVKSVKKGGKAEQSGVCTGWQIKAVNRVQVSSVEQVQQMFDDFAAAGDA